MDEQRALTEFSEKSEREPDSVLIFMDEREAPSGIKKTLETFGARVDLRVLNVGDFILSERVVAERKTRADFESSIVDGRLFAQAKNLIGNFERALLIVEGERFEERVAKPALLGALASLIADYGIPIFFTKDEEKTAELLFAIAKREQLGEKREIRLKGDKRAHGLGAQQQMLIECLPGVGPKRAKSLLAHFKTVEKIINAGERELQEVEGIGKETARAIRKVLASEYKE